VCVCECVYVCVHAVKKCGRSRKNIMASTVNLKEVFDLVSTEWEKGSAEIRDSRYDVSPDLPQVSKVSLCTRQELIPFSLPLSHYLLLLHLYKHTSLLLASLMQKYRAHLNVNTGAPPTFMHDWSPPPGALTQREQDWMDKITESSPVNTQTKKITRAKYGNAFFCTAEYQQDKGKVNDNRCVMMKFEDEETKVESITYGIITHMYYHQLFHNKPPRVVIIADWFDPIGVDVFGLTEVKYNPLFESEKGAFLSACEPVNFMLWPSKPFEYDFKRASYMKPDHVFTVCHR
jgi:hypothetical protein